MDPLLKKVPPLRRALLFVPVALAAAFVAFLLVGFPTNQVAVALLLAPFAGVATAWLLLGWPKISRKDGRPLVEPRVKPWLFFLLFPLFAAFAYPFLGLSLSPVLPPGLVVYVPLGLALVVAGAGAYFAVGFPSFGKDIRGAWARVPPRTRPWLSIPLGLFLSLLLYFAIGWALTAYLNASWAPLAALPAGVILGFTGAVLLLGFPKPERPVLEMVPRPPGNARPGLLLATWLLLGFPSAFAVGLSLDLVPLLPKAFELPASLLAGFLISFGLAVLIWGLPGRWRKLPDYTPGLAPEVRAALALPLTVAVAGVVAFVLGMVGLDLAPALLIGTVAGLTAAVFATGSHRRIRELRPPEAVPEKVKPLLLFPTWLVLSAAVFIPLTWFLPSWLPLNLVGALAVGFVAAFLLVQRDLLAEWSRSRARRVALKEEISRMRAERLGAPRPAAAAPPAEAAPRRSLLSRLGRRK